MNLKLFLNRKNIIDREWDNFYKMILLICSSKLLASDSENAFLFFENLFRVICLCLFIIFLFIVCRFVLMYPTVCV